MRTHSAVPSCAARTSSSPTVSVPRSVPSSASTMRRSHPACARSDAAPLRDAELLVVGEVPARHSPAELGSAVRGEHGHAVALAERVGDIGIERRGARHHRTDAGEHVVPDVGVEHHAQRGRHERDSLGLVLAYRRDPAVDGEPLEQRDATAVEHRLQRAEHAAHVHERRVEDDDTGAEPEIRAGPCLVVLRSPHDQLEHLVAQVDALGRAGGAAGEHAHRDAGRRRDSRWTLGGRGEIDGSTEATEGAARGSRAGPRAAPTPGRPLHR